MNIFVTNYNPTACAMEHCLVHRNKMLVEYAQLMSTKIRLREGTLEKVWTKYNVTITVDDGVNSPYEITETRYKEIDWYTLPSDTFGEYRGTRLLTGSIVYKPTHTNHPSAKWVRESEANYAWLYSLWSDLGYLFLNREYKHHKSFAKLRSLLAPKLSNDDTLLMLANRATFNESMLAMPDKYKSKSIALSYQRYLSSKFNEWQGRSNPIRVKFEHGKPLWYND